MLVASMPSTASVALVELIFVVEYSTTNFSTSRALGTPMSKRVIMPYGGAGALYTTTTKPLPKEESCNTGAGGLFAVD
jgi:hypothetical protein